MSTNSDEDDEKGSGKYSRYAAMPSSMLVSSSPPPPSQDGSRPTAQMIPSTTLNDNKNNHHLDDNDNLDKNDIQSLRKWMDVAYKTNDYEAVIVISRLLIQHRDGQSSSNNGSDIHNPDNEKGTTVQIYVKSQDFSSPLVLHVHPTDTVGQLKEQIYTKSSTLETTTTTSTSDKDSDSSLHPLNQKLIYFGKVLDNNEEKLIDLSGSSGIQEGTTFHLVKRLRGGDQSGESGVYGAALPSQLLVSREDTIKKKKERIEQKLKAAQPKFSALPAGLLDEEEEEESFSDSSIGNYSGAAMPSALIGKPSPEPVGSGIPMHVVQQNRMEITVKNLEGKTILCTKLNTGYTTVAMLKNMLHEEKGYFPVDQQRLLFAGKNLENHMYLSEYGVQPSSTIYSIEKVEGGGAMPSKLLAERDDSLEPGFTNDDFGRVALPSGIQSEGHHQNQNEENCMINITLSSTDIISGHHMVQINSKTATIETIQSEIYRKIGIPPYVQHLVLKGVGLQIPTDNASQTLASEFGILDGSTVICSIDQNHTSSRSGSSRLEFVVKTLAGKVSHIAIDSPDATTVRAVKEILYKKEGIPVNEQRLIFAGKQLEDDKYLSEYGMPPWSTLHLVLRLRKGAPSKELQEKLNNASSTNDKDHTNNQNYGYFTNDNKGKTLAMFGLQSIDQLQEMKSITVNFKRNAKGPSTNVMKKVAKDHINGTSKVEYKNYPDINVAISAEEYLSDVLDKGDDIFDRDGDASGVDNMSDNVKESDLMLKWMIGSGNVNSSETIKFSSGSIAVREKNFNSIDAFWRRTKNEVISSLSMQKDIGPLPSPPPSTGMPMPEPTYVAQPPPPAPMPMPGPSNLVQPSPHPMPMPDQIAMPVGSPMPAAPIPLPYEFDDVDGAAMPDEAAMPQRIDLNCCRCVSLVCLAKLIPRWDLQSAKDQHRNRRITDEKEREEAWSNYIENHPDIGVITLAYMHSGNSHKFLAFFVRFLLVALVVVQLIIPILVAYNEASQYYDNEEGTPIYCPSTADALNRTLAVTIGIIYLGKLTFICLQKFSDSDNSPVLDESEYGGTIQLAIAADRWMHLVYEPGIYMLNLWIVYITLEPLDMVLNALAMEFILQLDDELKPIYLAVFEPDIDSYKEENNENGTKRIGSRQYVIVVLSSLLSLWSMIFLCVGIYAATIYLPICKPGES